MLLESNTAELYDTQMSVIRRLVSAIFFFVRFGAAFADTQSSWSAPGLYLKRPLLMNKYLTENNIAGLIYLRS